MDYTAFYTAPLLPVAVCLGAVLLLLVVPVFAVAAIAVLLLAGIALALALVAALVAAPFLIAGAARRYWRGRSAAPTGLRVAVRWALPQASASIVAARPARSEERR